VTPCRKALLVATSALGVALASGCTPSSDPKAASTVAAKVNGDEITVLQIDQALSRAGNIPDAQQKEAQKQMLERLIDQQLLVHQAVQKKLDRDPHVLALVDAAKRQILAQAYLEQVMQGAPKSTAQQVKAFYLEHPELFEDRRIYRFKEMAIAAPPDLQPQLRGEVTRLERLRDKARIMSQLALWLQAHDVKFQTNLSVQAAEQLPSELVGKIHQMKEGDLLVVPRGNALVVTQLDRSQRVPLGEEQATLYIEQILQHRKRLDLSSETLSRLRTSAKLEYLGEFAKRDGSGVPSPSEAASQPKQTERGQESK
jgi:EpsD family peptidyl-prolyl cis-trans isomerase